MKAFSVYSDAKKPVAPRTSNLPQQNQGIRRTDTHKRAADSTFGSRPSKSFRSGEPASKHQDPGMSLASIEALVEARVAQCVKDHLAGKALQDASAPVPAISAELQKRLDDLENRIEAQEDEGKSPGKKHDRIRIDRIAYSFSGLEFLLMGKQHKARGEDGSALRMYQMALPYFPDNEKLKAKIRGLEDRIRIKKESEAVVHASKTSSKLMAPLKSERKDVSVMHDEDMDDGEFAPGEDLDQDESYASDGSFSYKPKWGNRLKNYEASI